MLPRLEAEERLKRITDAGAGAGLFDRHDHSALIRGLEQAVGTERPKPRKVNSDVLAHMGVGVRFADRVEKDQGNG